MSVGKFASNRPAAEVVNLGGSKKSILKKSDVAETACTSQFVSWQYWQHDSFHPDVMKRPAIAAVAQQNFKMHDKRLFHNLNKTHAWIH
jgi:hypothetical protein